MDDKSQKSVSRHGCRRLVVSLPDGQHTDMLKVSEGLVAQFDIFLACDKGCCG